MSPFLNNRRPKKFWITMQIKIERKLATKCNFKSSSCAPIPALRVTSRHSEENTQGVLSSTVQQHLIALCLCIFDRIAFAPEAEPGV